jgi:sec-independent protein translocase protein TatB
MYTVLFVFEFLGTTELLVVAVVALILFGPRKLPEIGRTVGKAIGEFKRASDDFKRTWEYEVELEQRNKPALDAAAASSAVVPADGAESLPPYDAGAESIGGAGSQPDDRGATVARGFADEDDGERPADAPTARAGDDDEINAS